MAPPRALLGILTIALALLAGCTQPNPMGEPTYTCTPTDDTTPYPCYKVQHDAKAKEDALYTEAETVYRKFFAEEERIYRAGGVTQPTPVLLETTTGQYQSDSMSIYRNLSARGLRIVDGKPVLAWVRRVPSGSVQGSVVAMKSCKDSSRVAMASGGAKPTLGRRVEETAYFMRVGSALKIGVASSKVVASC